MNVEKNPTEVADSYEKFGIIKAYESIEDPYKNINDVLDIIEALIDKRKQNDKEVS